MQARREMANELGRPSGNEASVTVSKKEFSSVMEPDSDESEGGMQAITAAKRDPVNEKIDAVDDSSIN